MLRKSRKLLIIALAISALGYFGYKFRNSITLEGFHWSLVGESLRHAHVSLLVLSLVTIYGCFAIRALRWMRFSRGFGRLKFSNVYPATLMGFTCTFLLGRAGEPIRPVLIGKKDSVSIPGMFGVYVLERVSDMAATAVLAVMALLFFKGHGAAGSSNPVVTKARSAGELLVVGVIFVIGFLVYFRYHGADWLSRRLQHPSWHEGWRGKIVALLEGFSEGLRGIRTWGDLGALVGYTALHWFLVACCYLWISNGFGGRLGDLTLADSILVLVFGMLGSAVQLPGVGGGAQIATFLTFTLFFKIDQSSAAVTSIMIWLITFAGCCLVGLPLLFREGWSMGELRQMAVSAEKDAENMALSGELPEPGEKRP
jgi:hypothetical protein